MKTLHIIPNESFRQAGATHPGVQKGTTYAATPATNQPNWKAEGKVFIGDLLLTKADYTLAPVYRKTMKTTQPYTPKAIRGQTFKGYTKVSRAQVAKLFADGQTFTGFIVGNKVHAFHFFGGWHLACGIRSNSLADFTSSLNSFHFYLDPELGDRAAIYLRKRCKAPALLPALSMAPLLVG